MKLPSLLILAFAALSTITASAAVTVNVTRSLSISDDDSVNTGDAGFDSTPSLINSSAATLTNLNDNAELGYRFTGYNSGRGVTNGIFQSQSLDTITQSINVSVTWTLTSSIPGEVYSFSLNPELHAYLNIIDDSNSEPNDLSRISNMAATLKQNGAPISDSLDLTGGSRTTVGSSNINDTNNSQTFSGLTGDNVFILQYSGSTVTSFHTGTAQDNRTANAVLWGQDGTMDGDSFPDNFDNYNIITNDPDGDGLFLAATIELTTVPEPAITILLMSLGCLGLVTLRHRRSRSCI